MEYLAKGLSFPKNEVERIILGALDAITEKLKQGEKVNLSGFGQFYTGNRSARTGVNPRNPKEKIQIPAVRVPKFRAGKNLKDRVK